MKKSSELESRFQTMLHHAGSLKLQPAPQVSHLWQLSVCSEHGRLKSQTDPARLMKRVIRSHFIARLSPLRTQKSRLARIVGPELSSKRGFVNSGPLTKSSGSPVPHSMALIMTLSRQPESRTVKIRPTKSFRGFIG